MKRTFLALTAASLRSFRGHPELHVGRRRHDSVDKVGAWFACALLATMLAGTAVPCDDEVAVAVMKLIDALEELDDVQNVYSNAEFPDSALDA
jgi:hypothetical protein